MFRRKTKVQVEFNVPRITARCLVDGCTRYCWGADQQYLDQHIRTTEWQATPFGYVCPTHARQFFAQRYFDWAPGEWLN